MTPISEWHYKLNKWCPVIIVWLILLAMLPLRIIVCLLLPADSIYEWHPLHKIKAFWGFE